MAKKEKENLDQATVENTEKKPEKKAKDDKSKKSHKSKPAKASKVSFPQKVSRYFKDLVGEFKKVVWPSKKQVINNTIVVLVFCAVVGIFVWILDLPLAAGMKTLLDLAK